MIDEQEAQRRRDAVMSAIGSVRMEGQPIDRRLAEDMHRYVRGEIELDEMLRRVHERVANGLYHDPANRTALTDSELDDLTRPGSRSAR
jgi:hypothetical protein